MYIKDYWEGRVEECAKERNVGEVKLDSGKPCLFILFYFLLKKFHFFLSGWAGVGIG